MVATFSDKPSIESWQTAEEIIGDKMEALKLHYRITIGGTGFFPETELSKEFTLEMRNEIASLYKKLRENGYYPDGFNKLGEINFRTALKAKINDIVESEIKNMSKRLQITNDMSKGEVKGPIEEMQAFVKGKFGAVG